MRPVEQLWNEFDQFHQHEVNILITSLEIKIYKSITVIDKYIFIIS